MNKTLRKQKKYDITLMKDKNLNILSPLNCFNLVYTCNIALILFLKCDFTKFRIPPLPCHTMSHFVDPLPPP